MNKKKKDWLTFTVEEITLPNGMKLNGLKIAVNDLQALRAVKKKVKGFLEDIMSLRGIQ
jgi:hypothetical protein|tara:strand:- start:2017 stop:2193 length:177 start_codon:yes stop_codon:yes gene_type:complete